MRRKGRPCKCRNISINIKSRCFKPRGIPIDKVDKLFLKLDELEAIRLADLEGLYHHDAAEIMGISRQTFGNILSKARKKISDAIINQKAIIVMD